MVLNIKDLIILVFYIWWSARNLPSFYKKILLFVRPLDATRYVEYAYILKFFKNKPLKELGILDVSSPHIMACVFSKQNKVTRVSIDPDEAQFTRENYDLHFQIEDATRLSFNENSFDFTYSVSVIEHIYNDYIQAIREMIRVTKKESLIYLSFPVSKIHQEEWVSNPGYPGQPTNNENRTFFQYRFSEDEVVNIKNEIINLGTTIISDDIFWEKKDGAYDILRHKLNIKVMNKYIDYIRSSILNFYYGITMFDLKSRNFEDPKSFGNMQMVIKK